MLKADFHTHTNYQYGLFEARHGPKKLIDRASELGFDVLAITEHEMLYNRYVNALGSYNDFKDYAEKKGILLIPGIELTIEGKHVLLLNFKGDPRKYKKIEDLRELKKQNVLIVAAHPFFKKRECLGNKLIEHITLFDAIEFSHFYLKHFNLNKRAVEVAKKYSKPIIGNSDAHMLWQMDYTYTLVDAEKNVDSVISAIRENKIKIVSRPLPLYLLFYAFVWVTLSVIPLLISKLYPSGSP